MRCPLWLHAWVLSVVAKVLKGAHWDALGYDQIPGLRGDEFSVLHPETGLGPCKT